MCSADLRPARQRGGPAFGGASPVLLSARREDFDKPFSQNPFDLADGAMPHGEGEVE